MRLRLLIGAPARPASVAALLSDSRSTASSEGLELGPRAGRVLVDEVVVGGRAGRGQRAAAVIARVAVERRVSGVGGLGRRGRRRVDGGQRRLVVVMWRYSRQRRRRQTVQLQHQPTSNALCS